MRHRRAHKNFSNHPDHRAALMRNMVLNLFTNGRIRTTLPKAKQARRLAERIIQLGKNGSLHDRRQAIEKLGSNEAAQKAVKWVFSELKERFKDRQGGYTRILKLPRTIRQAQSDLPRNPGVARSKMYGTNLGDNAPLVLWELCEAQITKKERPKKAARNWKPKAKEEVKAPAK